MSEEKQKKRKRAHGEPEQAGSGQGLKAGQMLQQARLAKGLELEEVSAAIHVRVAQLKAIEEDHIEALPGMTYALGFVKSYANFLKADTNDIMAKFRAEHGAASQRPQLHTPEPIAESKMPDPMMLGIAGFCVVLLIVAWAIFAGGDGDHKKLASQIPPAPVVQDAATAMMAPAAAPAGTSAAAAPAAAPTATAAAAPAATPAAGTAPAIANAPIPTGPLTAPVTPVAPPAAGTPPAVAAVAAPAAAPGAVAATTTTAAMAPVTAPLPTRPNISPGGAMSGTLSDDNPPPTAAPQIQWDTPAPVINVKRGRSRITLRAHQASWVQVSDAGGRVLFKKVLRDGDKYYVPDIPGATLVTSNAGGLDVSVDGADIQPLGDNGEILRGVPLNADTLKNSRTHVRHYE